MEEIIAHVLAKNADTMTAGYDSFHQQSPLDQVMAMEEGGAESERDREEWAVRVEAFSGLLEFFFSEGPEPLAVIRRLFAIAKALRPDLLRDMSLEDVALLCDDAVRWDPNKGKEGEWVAGRATVSARIKRIYGGTLKKAGMRATKAPFQKSASAVENFRKAQMGNKNRNKNLNKRRRSG